MSQPITFSAQQCDRIGNTSLLGPKWWFLTDLSKDRQRHCFLNKAFISMTRTEIYAEFRAIPFVRCKVVYRCSPKTIVTFLYWGESSPTKSNTEKQYHQLKFLLFSTLLRRERSKRSLWLIYRHTETTFNSAPFLSVHDLLSQRRDSDLKSENYFFSFKKDL